ncbi:MAG: hypothetical protein CBE16_07185 [Rhodospirillaceae bacterium TMED256]|nr:MAG: hypothetical protein CBE16_07185 [Rhodospirillaceae bacterium TMED256]
MIERSIAPGEHAFINIARIEDTSANLQVAQLHADGISRKLTRHGAIPYSHGSEPAPNRQMRLSYLSADFRDHAIGHLIAGLFAHRERAACGKFTGTHHRILGKIYRSGDPSRARFRRAGQSAPTPGRRA